MAGKREAEGPCFLRFLTVSSGCWRSLGAWRSALTSTRLMPWPHSERITLAGPTPGCALVGTRPVRSTPRLLPLLL